MDVKLRKRFRLVVIKEYYPKNGTVKVTNGERGAHFVVPVQLIGIEYKIPDLEKDVNYLKEIEQYIIAQSTFAIDRTMVCNSITCSNKLYQDIEYMSDAFINALANNEAVHVELFESFTDSLFYLPIHMVEFL